MISKDLEKAIQLLDSKKYTLVIYENGKFDFSIERGVKSLVSIYESGSRLANAHVADKVIGKAAACMYVLLKAKEVFAYVLSSSAKKVLERFNIPIFYDAEVPFIINRTKTDLCPLEKAVLDIDEPIDAYRAIVEKLKKI